MNDGKIISLLALVSVLLFLMPNILRLSPEGRLRLGWATIGIYALAMSYALWLVAVWAMG